MVMMVMMVMMLMMMASSWLEISSWLQVGTETTALKLIVICVTEIQN